MSDIQLGATYRDVVSGFQGVATSKSTFLMGCARVTLVRLSANRESVTEYTVDEPQLKFLEEATQEVLAAVEGSTVKMTIKGGERSAPKRPEVTRR